MYLLSWTETGTMRKAQTTACSIRTTPTLAMVKSLSEETVTDSDDLVIKPIPAKTYNGKLQKPSVSVSMKKDGKEKKLSKKDYTIVYEDNFHAGEATAISR